MLRQISSLLARTNSPAAKAAKKELAEVPPPAASTPSRANSRSNQDCMLLFTRSGISNIIRPEEDGLTILETREHPAGHGNKFHTFERTQWEERLQAFSRLHQRHAQLATLVRIRRLRSIEQFPFGGANDQFID